MIPGMPEPHSSSPRTPRPAGGFLAALAGRLRAFLRGLREGGRPAPAPTPDAAQLAAEVLALALAENDPMPRLARLRAALAQCERLSGSTGDVMVLEASLHLGERLRALGQSDEAVQ